MTPGSSVGARRRRRSLRAAAAAAALGAAAWGAVSVADSAVPARTAKPARSAPVWQWHLPQGFPTPRVPRDNPMTAEKVELGRFLFYDTRLSGNGKQACGSCHMQELAFTDGLAQAVGSTGETHPRSSQSLTNVAFNSTLTWANPSLVRLEKQMEVPLFGERPIEMGVNDANKGRVLARFKRDGWYRGQFAKAFPGQKRPVNWRNVVLAISAFQRTIVSGDSRYDRMLSGTAKFTPAEARGAELFFGERAECHHCHGGFNFSEQVNYVGTREVNTIFRNTGLYNVDGQGGFPEPNRGVFELTNRPEDMGAFRAPTLRNIAVTAPYMHDGSVATLQDVVNSYAEGGRLITTGPLAGDGRANPHKDPLISGITLTEQDKSDLVAFLGTLTDRRFLTRKDLSNPFLSRR